MLSAAKYIVRQAAEQSHFAKHDIISKALCLGPFQIRNASSKGVQGHVIGIDLHNQLMCSCHGRKNTQSN